MKNQKGFTLIELITVLIIIAVLIIVAVGAFTGRNTPMMMQPHDETYIEESYDTSNY